MPSGWKSVAGFVLWMAWNIGLYVATKALDKKEPEVKWLVFLAAWNSALWFAFQVGDIKRRLQEKE